MLSSERVRNNPNFAVDGEPPLPLSNAAEGTQSLRIPRENAIRTPRSSRRRFTLPALWVLATLLAWHSQAAAQQSQPPAMREYLEARVRARPEDPASWRMLGHVLLEAGEYHGARETLSRAVELDSNSAAARFDLGLALLNLGDRTAAAEQFQHATKLAPESEYAARAREHLARLPASAPSGEIALAGYEVRDFTGEDRIDRILREEPYACSPWSVYVEMGGQYNSNVALTPTSRGLTNSEAAGWQAFISPELEYRLVNGEQWRSGPLLAGFFSLNEGPASDLNLQSYQPGWFVERSVYLETSVLVPRLSYQYTLDQFSGFTFGDRSAFTGTLTNYWDSGNTSVVYARVDFTEFADDGLDPAFTSQDGWTTSFGFSHRQCLGRPLLEAVVGGFDFELVDTEGTDNTFRGAAFYLETETRLTEGLSLFLSGNVGFRDYYQFTGTPPRDELVWGLSARLQQQFTDNWSVAAVFRYDSFDSDNAEYQAERYIAGLMSVFEF